MNILAIETSCDETAAAIVVWHPPSSDFGEARDAQATVLANTVSSQASLHSKWGGVVPDLASREHIKNIVPVITETLTRANMKPADIDLIAVTQGPGLMPALLIGVSAAKTLALVWQKPLIGIHHIEGHIYANFLSNNNQQLTVNEAQGEKIFPLVALVVSGGHTELVLMRDHFQYEILGETQDDAAGEAFDKVAKMLGLPYPGGPIVAKRADAFLASTSLITHHSSPIPVSFPRPMMHSDDFHFSFSGLKTAVLYFLKKHPEKMNDASFIDQVCSEFQEAVVDVLVAKTVKALKRYAPKTLVIAGGVSANTELRNRLRNLVDTEFPETRFLTPQFQYSLDNAAMIGAAAGFRYGQMSEQERRSLSQTYLTLDPNANLPLQNLHI